MNRGAIPYSMPGHRSPARREKMNTKLITTMAVLLLFGAAILPASAQLQYNVIDLGVLTDTNGNPGTSSYANQINNANQVVGGCFIDSQTPGFLWDNGTLISMVEP